MTNRERLLALAASLPEDLAGEVLDFAEAARRRAAASGLAGVQEALAALPEEEEELTDDTRRDLESAKTSHRQGASSSLDTVALRLGLD